VTPFLNSLSKECIFYPYTLSFHKAGSTSDCEFSIISSIEPFHDFPSIKLRNYDYPNSMLKPLVGAGYDAIAFHGNRGTYFNRHIALKKMGFRSFYDMMAMGLEEKAWGAPDGDMFNYIQKKLTTQKSPFCYYIITMSSHEPFNLMQSYFSTKAYDDVKDEFLKRFLTAMTYIDGELGKFIGYLRKNTQNTYIFIYGDHTPAIPNTVYKKASFNEMPCSSSSSHVISLLLKEQYFRKSIKQHLFLISPLRCSMLQKSDALISPMAGICFFFRKTAQL
jgi:lipoteichoic acid synthase